ncbi:GNS1/SUR4 family-domain-containing protein [Mycena galericulata]|nr:GNS1/SUR4 family-domain-containing protein [Mycena galericulata]
MAVNDKNTASPVPVMEIPLGSAWMVLCVLGSYLTFVSTAQSMMKNRMPFRPRRLMHAYNICLSAVSLILLWFMLEEIISLIRRAGVMGAMCAPESYTKKLDLYYRLNYGLKYVELLDTLFLVLMKKRLRFLHVYHHTSTIFLCYIQLQETTTMAAYLPLMLQWKKHLTGLQIIQFVVVGPTMVLALAVAHISPTSEACPVSPVAVLVGTIVLTSHFLLFVEFYFTAYIKRSLKTAVGKTA